MISVDGRTIWLRTSIRLVTKDTSTPELVGVMTDITERKQAQEIAEAASAAKGALLSEIERLNEKLKKENIRMSAELDVTRRLQRMMAPRTTDLQGIADLDISFFMESAAEVGGDYYDVIRDEQGIVMGIGDVTGHGLESGVLAIMVHTAVRTLLASGQRRSREFFEILNRVIYGNTRRMNIDRNLTMSLIRYEDRAITISGQHEEVLVVRSDGTFERHDTLNLGYPLGLQEDISSWIGEAKVPLQSGDVLVLYTDGITEAINCAGVTYGIERLAESICASHDQPAETIRQSVLNSLRQYVGDQELLDDISLVVVKPV
jgi:sigma-B regulation protein RsbU (phosphoserine phosphatase)